MAGAAGILPPRRAPAAEPALETTTVRLAKFPGSICVAPQYICDELLRAEGFTDVHYVDVDAGASPADDLGRGKFDFTISLTPQYLVAIDSRAPITVLAGVHVGCYELFANEEIRSIGELKGKSVGAFATPEVLAIMAAYVGLDPTKDLNWVRDPNVRPLELFVEGKLDAYLAFPPEPQMLRARAVGHVIVNTAVDRPWSQYFCCMLAGNREFVRDHPIATKRTLRAILKATDLCVTEPARVARQIVDGGFTPRYDYALQTLNEVPYDKWREYDPEDTVRFYSLRLHEVGMVKASPQKIIADGTDWRFLNELKRELKA
jgi:NitT/TauT family transport system substrate-binding protein